MVPVVLALVSALLFGAATPASKALLDDLDPVQLAGWLYLGAALGVLPAILRRGGFTSVRRIGRRSLLRLLGAIVCGGILGPVALLFGLRLASAASVSLWLNLELVATAILGQFLFRDRLGRLGWIGATGVVAASVVLSAGEGRSGLAAIVLVLLACLLWGLDNHLTALIDGIAPTESTFWKGLVAGSFNLALATFLGVSLPGPGSVSAAMLVGAFSYGVSIALYITSAHHLGATRAQMVFASAPFFGAALSGLFLAEPLGLRHVLAAALLSVSLALLFRDAHAHTHGHEEVEHEHWHRHDDGHHHHEHAGLPASTWHSHGHRHEAVEHRHRHWHDLHHRHTH